MTSLSRIKNYPLKVYLAANDAVVLSYADIFYKDDFEVEDISCIIPKSDFYVILKRLSESKSVKITYGKKSISIIDCDTYVKTVISNGTKEETIIQKERCFINWLLSIDLRKAERVDCSFPISIENDEVIGYGRTLDISSSGFKIELDIELKEGEKINVSLFDKKHALSTCACDVKHISLKNGKYIYGLRILDITIENIYNLDRLISNIKNSI